jgi:hypothetical protein
MALLNNMLIAAITKAKPFVSIQFLNGGQFAKSLADNIRNGSFGLSFIMALSRTKLTTVSPGGFHSKRLTAVFADKSNHFLPKNKETPLDFGGVVVEATPIQSAGAIK